MTKPAPQTALKASALTIGYRRGAKSRSIATNLDLSLKAGEFVCLLGPNGTGKSTLITTLAGMQAPIAGQIQISGRNFHSIPPRQRAKLVSVVLTDTATIGMMDAYTMVSIGRHPYSGYLGALAPDDRERIHWAIEAVGAQHLAHRQITELSDGERQKISIARALAQETKVMLLDEPTAFLDLPRRVELMKILRSLAHNQSLALLLSTHDLDLALRFADRLWVLTPQGELIQDYPETIAMSNDFARVFESENLDWDASIGSFRAHPEPSLQARVIGEELSGLWTRRAVERLGFGLTESEHAAALIIQIDKQPCWRVASGSHEAEFGSLSAMIDWILQQEWTGGRDSLID